MGQRLLRFQMQCYIIHVCTGKGCLDEVVRVILHDQMDRKCSDLDPLLQRAGIQDASNRNWDFNMPHVTCPTSGLFKVHPNIKVAQHRLEMSLPSDGVGIPSREAR